MPPKRSAAVAAVTGGGPVAASPSPKRVKVSAESSRGTQQKLEAFFTSPKKPKSQSAGAVATAKQLHSPLKRPEVIVIDDGEGEHQISTCLLSEHSNERRPAAGNGSDGPVIIPATPMEEDRLGVRCKEENSSMEEYGMDTDMLLARRLARVEGNIDIELARKLESGFQTGINKLDGLGSPSSASPNVRGPFVHLSRFST